jgi:hypothetical protein
MTADGIQGLAIPRHVARGAVQLRLYGLIRQWEADIGLVRSLGPTREVHFEQELSIGWFDRL